MGTWDVDGLLDEIPNRLLIEWMDFYKLEPFGALRDNIHAGIIAATVWQSVLNPSDRKSIKPSDFLLTEAEEKPKQAPDEIFMALRACLVRR